MDGVELLADKDSKSWDFAERIQKYLESEKKVRVPLNPVSIEHFANGEIDMCAKKNVRKKSIYFIHDPSKDPQEWWVQLLLVKDLLLSASAESVTFVLPDMLYSRKDRKEKPHVPISARILARTISPNLKRIITMDLHASQIQGFYPESVPLDNLYSFPAVIRYLKENESVSALEKLVVVSPDAGGVDRARAFSQRLNSRYPLAFIYKRRDEPGKIKEMILVGDVKDKDILIVDDITDSGGTLCKAAELLEENGAKRKYCYVTHGFFTEGTQEVTKHFDKVMTSNTHYQERDGISVIDVSPVFAEAIYRAQKGLSISELFE